MAEGTKVKTPSEIKQQEKRNVNIEMIDGKVVARMSVYNDKDGYAEYPKIFDDMESCTKHVSKFFNLK